MSAFPLNSRCGGQLFQRFRVSAYRTNFPGHAKGKILRFLCFLHKNLRIMVGVAGFEPTASWTRTKRDTKLRHTPNLLDYYKGYSWKSQELFFPYEGNSFSIRKHFSIVIVLPLASWRRSVVRRSARTQFAAGRSKELRHLNRPAGDCSPAANRTAECRPYRAEPLLSIRKQFFLTRKRVSYTELP